MKNKRIILISALLVLCCLWSVVLTGCDNNNNTAETAAEAQATQNNETAAVTEAATEAETEEAATQAQAEPAADAEGSPLIGSWEYEEMAGFTYTFNADGTGKYDIMGEVMNFTYTDNGDSFTMTYDDMDTPTTLDYVIEGDTLTVKDSFGTDVRYVKK